MLNIEIKDFIILILAGYISLLVARQGKHLDVRFQIWSIVFDYYKNLYIHIDNCLYRVNRDKNVYSSLLINFNEKPILIELNKYKPILKLNIFIFMVNIIKNQNKISEISGKLRTMIITYNKSIMFYSKDITLDDIEYIKSLLEKMQIEIDNLLEVYEKILFK